MFVFIILLVLLITTIILQSLVYIVWQSIFFTSIVFQFILLLFSIISLFIKRNKQIIITSIISIILSISLIIPNCVLTFNIDAKENIKFVAHAGGSLENHTYTNSQESFLNCINNNINLIELDFLYTADKQIVCSHEFENIGDFNLTNRPTIMEYKNSKIYSLYNGITFDWLILQLKENPNIKIVFDTKEEDAVALLANMIEISKTQDFDIFNRFIIQVYSIENYNALQVFNFAEYWFTNYKAEYSISKINEYFEDKENVTTIVLYYNTWMLYRSFGFNTKKEVAVHTLSKQIDIDFVSKRGVDIIYID